MTERALKAAEYGTLPEFVFKLKHEEFYRNFESDVATFGFENPKVVVSTQINPYAEVTLDLSDEDIFKFYILSNVNFLNFISSSDYKLAILSFGLTEDEARVFDDLFYQIHRDPKLRAEIINEIIYERQEFRQTMLEKRTEYDEMKSALPWKVSRQKEISKNIVYELSIRNTLLGIFDSIVPDAELPLITVNNYYKKYKGYRGLIEYPENKNEILLFFKGSRILLRDETVDFVNPTYTVILPKETDILRSLDNFITIDTIISKGNVLNLEFSMTADQEIRTRLDKVVWADLCMNSILAADFAVDESARATKQYSTIYSWWLKGKDRVSFQLREDVKFNSVSKETDYSVEVRTFNISEDNDYIDEFQHRVGEALGYYYASARRIAKEYNVLLPRDINLDIEDDAAKKIRLKNIASDIFVAGYPRMCQFMPEVISEQDRIVLEEKGYHVMRFPKESDSALLFSCSLQKKHTFPGLKANRLSNKDSYPLVPCCFKEDQREKKSYYRQYYEGQEKARSETARVLSTEKLVKLSQQGTLPPELDSYIVSLGDLRARRCGVLKDKGSIIDCILESVDPKHARKSERTRKRDTDEIRKTIEDYYFNFCRQETARITKIDSINVFRNLDEFIDASMFYTLLERFFHCRLVIFSRDNFKHPYFTNGFVHANLSKSWPVVVVYENPGSKTENLRHPQYELIETKIDTERIYEDYMSSLVTWKIDKGILTHYRITDDEKETINPMSLDSQILDITGKTAAINLVLGGRMQTFYLFNHVPPLSINISLKVFHSETYKEEYLEINGLGTVKGYFSRAGDSSSLLEQFVSTRRQSKALVEQAKYLFSTYGKINFHVSPDARGTIPSDAWLKENKLNVPNQIVADRVTYVVKLFDTQNRKQLQAYSRLQFIPYNFDSILDFTQYPGCDIGETGTDLIDGASFKLEEPKGQSNLFVKVGNEAYFCTRVSRIPDAISARVFVWQTREVLEMPQHIIDILVAGQFVYQMQKIS